MEGRSVDWLSWGLTIYSVLRGGHYGLLGQYAHGTFYIAYACFFAILTHSIEEKKRRNG